MSTSNTELASSPPMRVHAVAHILTARPVPARTAPHILTASVSELGPGATAPARGLYPEYYARARAADRWLRVIRQRPVTNSADQQAYRDAEGRDRDGS